MIAVNSPYSGGNPAMMAKATPCGSTMAAPVSPASAPAFHDAGVCSRNHGRIGDRRLKTVLVRAIGSSGLVGFPGAHRDRPENLAQLGLVTITD